jgi:hypothetical protein
LKFELAVFVDDELSGGIKDAGAFALVLIGEIEFAGGEVVGGGGSVGVDFAETKQTVGDEANLAAGVRGNQANVAEVVADGAGYSDASDGVHLGEGVDEALILSFFEGIDEDLAIFFGGEFVDADLDVDDFAELRAGALGRGVDDFDFPVVGGNGKSDGGKKKSGEQESAKAKLASVGVRIVAMCHCCPFEKAGRMPESERKKNADSG